MDKEEHLMKRYLLPLLSFFLLTAVSHVSAHPGRTDANGGHTCRTNCEKWGLQYGEYHYHNKGSSKQKAAGSGAHSPSRPPATSAPGKNPNQARPQVVLVPIVAVEKAAVYSTPVQAQTYAAGFVEYGTILRDTGGTEGWVTLPLANGRLGYVPKTVMTQYAASSPKTITVHAEKGYVFNIPSESGTVRGSFSKGTRLNAIGENGNWYFISTPDGNGGTHKGFISKSVAW
jgi:hypothetical protein